MGKKLTKVYVTKYALTSGPFAIEAELLEGGSIAYWVISGFGQSVHGRDFWLTSEAALSDCERRRKDKLASLAKQIAKLEVKTFKIKEG